MRLGFNFADVQGMSVEEAEEWISAAYPKKSG
jgi:hypothetical protein